jgi:hypothetical protein
MKYSKGAGKRRKKSLLCCSCKTSIKKVSEIELPAGEKYWIVIFRLNNESLELVMLV